MTPTVWEFRKGGRSVWATGGRVEHPRTRFAADFELFTWSEAVWVLAFAKTFLLSMVVGMFVAGWVR